MNRLLLDRNALAKVIIDSGTQRAHSAGGRASGGSTITTEAIEASRRFNPKCRCDTLGLAAGMPASGLADLGSGCTGIDSPVNEAGSAWVCEVLDALRRRYGR